MKRIIRTGIVVAILLFSLSGCGKHVMTLEFENGQRTGTYSGRMQGGRPHGFGTFITKTEDGQQWTYEGKWNNGHFEGEGKITWQSGYAR